MTPMFYFKAPGRLMQGSNAVAWGRITSYLEIGHDQRAVRQLDVFENGNILRYDRLHNWDDYGVLVGLKFSRKQKWAKFFPGAEMVAQEDFDRVWRAAERSNI